MNVLERISIKGYRRLYDVSLKMAPLAVLIGANGVGKTSLLEVFSLLSASASGRLEPKIAELGGLTDILTRDRAHGLEFGLSTSVPDHAPLNYNLEIAQKGQAYEIRSETLTQHNDPAALHPFKHIESHGMDVRYSSPDGKGPLRPNWEHSYLETSLSQVPKMYQAPESLRRQLASCTFYGALDVAPKSPVRLPQPMRPATLPGPNGEDLVSCLYYLRETDRARFDTIVDTLSAAFDDFESLSFPPVAAGTLAMTWKDKNFSAPFFTHQLSEGTLRFLWLVTLLQSRSLTPIILIDEPEVSLHPALLQMLPDLMREASTRTQLVVATHSDILIRFLEPKEVLVCDADEGVTTMTWADSLDLERWLADYTLDQIWNMNLVGGRP